MPARKNPLERDTDTERKILVAATTVFIRRGTAGARMQEIAEEAGVNQALLHYYFRSKERLASTVFREAAGQLFPAVLALFASGAPLEEKVKSFVHIYIDTVRRSPFIPAYVLSEMHHHPERLTAMLDSAGVEPTKVVKAFRARLTADLADLEKRGFSRPISADQFLLNMAGLVVMPFIVRPALRIAFAMDDKAFSKFLDERRAILPALILNSLRP